MATRGKNSKQQPTSRRADTRPLQTYAAKRQFTRTPEPAPKVIPARRGPLLFVVQQHAARRLHYDFRLELDGVLKSWAIPKGPSMVAGERRLAVEVEDHPFDYASFEGIIPAGEYGAGKVIVWDCGVYLPDEDGEVSFKDRAGAQEQVRAAFAANKLSIFLRGSKLKGSFALVKTSGERQWLLIKHRDRFAGNEDVRSRSRSVLSGLDLDELTEETIPQRLPAHRLAPWGPAERMPVELRPMLAEIGHEPRTEPGWLYEPKIDGYRVLAFVRNDQIRLLSRRGQDYTALFPEIVEELSQQRVDSMILDGEVIALDRQGKPSFNLLQNRAQLKTERELTRARREAPVILVCFDLLHFAGLNLRGAPYEDRRRYLTQCLLPSVHLQLIHATREAEALYRACVDSGLEGIVAKRRDSPYLPGRRSGAWRKIKAVNTGEFLVGGYTRGKGGRERLGALLLGYRSNGELIYAGHVGTGLTDALIRELLKRIARLERKSSPFKQKPPLHRPTVWLQPEVVVEVKFAEWTKYGILRAPVLLHVRTDIEPGKVTRVSATGGVAGVRMNDDSARMESVLEQLEDPADRITLDTDEVRIRLTHLNRVYWPADPRTRQAAITKRDFLRYLTLVSPYMLPHLRDRPLTAIRMPEGIGGERFFQKHWGATLPEFADRVTVFSESKNEKHTYIMANNLPTLLWVGQQGTLELHVWHSRCTVAEDAAVTSTEFSASLQALENSVLNYPDYLVFDIDPYIYSGKEPAGAEPEYNRKAFAVGRQVAFWLRELLQRMSLEPVVKTSGKTGLHVFVPIERTITFDEARKICHSIGKHLLREHPREVTLEWAVRKRTGKIFIDYNMNARGKTLNVAYSPRGVPGAPVSMPLTWEELEKAEPSLFTIANVPARLEKSGDRWQDVLAAKQSLTRAFDSSGA